MIVKVGSWNKNPIVSEFCLRLESLEGVSKKSTPQRCVIKANKATIATVGLENQKLVIEFLSRKCDFPEAHGADFCDVHPLPQLAKEGWLQARPSSSNEEDNIVAWIAATRDEIVKE